MASAAAASASILAVLRVAICSRRVPPITEGDADAPSRTTKDTRARDDDNDVEVFFVVVVGGEVMSRRGITGASLNSMTNGDGSSSDVDEDDALRKLHHF